METIWQIIRGAWEISVSCVFGVTLWSDGHHLLIVAWLVAMLCINIINSVVPKMEKKQ